MVHASTLQHWSVRALSASSELPMRPVQGFQCPVGRKEASEFVRSNSAHLATCPVWLLTSGPLGAAPMTTRARPGGLLQPQRVLRVREGHHAMTSKCSTALEPHEHDGAGRCPTCAPARATSGTGHRSRYGQSISVELPAGRRCPEARTVPGARLWQSRGYDSHS